MAALFKNVSVNRPYFELTLQLLDNFKDNYHAIDGFNGEEISTHIFPFQLNLYCEGCVASFTIHYKLQTNFFVSGLIFWTERGQLAEESWRDLATVVGTSSISCCRLLFF
jgi:hypothetical protein